MWLVRTEVKWVNCRFKTSLGPPRITCPLKKAKRWQKVSASGEPTPGELAAGSLFLLFHPLSALPLLTLPAHCCFLPNFLPAQYMRWQHNSKLSRSFYHLLFHFWENLASPLLQLFFKLNCSLASSVWLDLLLLRLYQFGRWVWPILVWFGFRSGVGLQWACCTYHHVARPPNQPLPTTNQHCKLFTPIALLAREAGHSLSQHHHCHQQ